MSREMALAAYRHVLRSTRIAFQGISILSVGDSRNSQVQTGDFNTLIAARGQARHNFEANRGLPEGSEEMSKSITHAEEVAKFLRENVVQGQAMDKDPSSYSKMIYCCASYVLRVYMLI
jgi:complex III assembly factor LYRM7